MELSEVYIIDAGWIFLAGWGLVVLAFGLVAFGWDLLPFTKRSGDAKRAPQR